MSASEEAKRKREADFRGSIEQKLTEASLKMDAFEVPLENLDASLEKSSEEIRQLRTAVKEASNTSVVLAIGWWVPVTAATIGLIVIV